MGEKRFEILNSRVSVAVNKTHRFGTDAFLLAHFAAPRGGDSVCDLGSGCGIIPLIFCREAAAAPARIWGVDIQAEAVALLEESVAACGLSERITPVCADLRDIPALRAHIPALLELITCNPPYKRAGAGILPPDKEDAIARHEVLCTMEDVCNAARALLRFGGRLCICQRPERLADAIGAMRAAGIEPKRLRTVAKAPDSPPWLFLLEGIAGGRPDMKIEPPLFIGEQTQNNEELLKIYGITGNATTQ